MILSDTDVRSLFIETSLELVSSAFNLLASKINLFEFLNSFYILENIFPRDVS